MRKFKYLFVSAGFLVMSVCLSLVSANPIQVAGHWDKNKQGHFIVEDTVEVIERGDFYNVIELTEITIPKSVKLVKSGAIDSCIGLNYINISAKEVEPFAVESWTNISEVRIMSEVEKLPGYYNDKMYCWRFLQKSGIGNCLYAGVYMNNCHPRLNTMFNPVFLVDSNNKNYSSDENGVLYNKQRSELISVPSYLMGKFVTPETVRCICPGSFLLTRLTDIIITDNVNYVPSEIINCYSYESNVSDKNRRLRLPEPIKQRLQNRGIINKSSYFLSYPNAITSQPVKQEDLTTKAFYTSCRGYNLDKYIKGRKAVELQDRHRAFDNRLLCVKFDSDEWDNQAYILDIYMNKESYLRVWDIVESQKLITLLSNGICASKVNLVVNDFNRPVKMDFHFCGFNDVKGLKSIKEASLCAYKLIDFGTDILSPEKLYRVWSITKAIRGSLERVNLMIGGKNGYGDIYTRSEIHDRDTAVLKLINIGNIEKYFGCKKICLMNCVTYNKIIDIDANNVEQDDLNKSIFDYIEDKQFI